MCVLSCTPLPYMGAQHLDIKAVSLPAGTEKARCLRGSGVRKTESASAGASVLDRRCWVERYTTGQLYAAYSS